MFQLFLVIEPLMDQGFEFHLASEFVLFRVVNRIWYYFSYLLM